jgi:sulfoxide reductase catalytic subunit YedY
MVIKRPPDVNSSEITDKKTYLSRRTLLAGGLALASPVLTTLAYRALTGGGRAVRTTQPLGVPVGARTRRPATAEGEPASTFEEITTYNNFYELGTDKRDPAANAHLLTVKPWTVAIEGLCRSPMVLGLEDLLRRFPVEERVYRFRCVEAWSMVIPWVGFPLRALLDVVQPLGSAKYVAFETVYRPAELPGQRQPILDWPYVEGLRMDEAMHPLTLMAVGLYGETLPVQNGAPIRLVVPWKYGFKSIKSVVRLRLVAERPPTTWNQAAPDEYGFYSNVNPDVDHPRWSQGSERRIGELRRRKTLPFNGYAEQVGALYRGMDLRKFY